MKEPVLILSDLHLGHPASKIESAEQLRPLIRGVGTIVFNGDTFQELARDFRPRSEALLGQLRSLCEELEIEAVFLPGNHDPSWEGPGWCELAGGKIVVTHGDAVMWGGSPWSREAIVRKDRVQALWDENEDADFDPTERIGLAKKIAWLLRPLNLPKGRSFLRRAMDAVDPPSRAFEILRVWISQAERAGLFAERYFPKASVLILGHFHRRGAWRSLNRLILNTGAFVNPHGANWITYSAGWLTVGRVEERGAEFLRGEALEVWEIT